MTTVVDVSKLNGYAWVGSTTVQQKPSKLNGYAWIGAPQGILTAAKMNVYAWLSPNPIPRRRIAGVSATVGRFG